MASAARPELVVVWYRGKKSGLFVRCHIIMSGVFPPAKRPWEKGFMPHTMKAQVYIFVVTLHNSNLVTGIYYWYLGYSIRRRPNGQPTIQLKEWQYILFFSFSSKPIKQDSKRTSLSLPLRPLSLCWFFYS